MLRTAQHADVGRRPSIASTGVPVASLVKGTYFGETALLSERAIRTANVIAVGYCDCFVLSRVAFQKITASYGIDRLALEASIARTLASKTASNKRHVRASMSSQL